MVARSRPGTSGRRPGDAFEWTMLASSICRCCSRCISRRSPDSARTTALIFGWLLLIDVGPCWRWRSRAVTGSCCTRSARSARCGGGVVARRSSYRAGRAAADDRLHVAVRGAVSRARRRSQSFERPFEGVGIQAILAAPLLLIVFPVCRCMREPAAASPLMIFAPLFVADRGDRLARFRDASGACTSSPRSSRSRPKRRGRRRIPRPSSAAGGAGDLRSFACCTSAFRTWRDGAAAARAGAGPAAWCCSRACC